MSDNSKPLFSRPVLAVIMVFCTFAVWVLQLTGENTNLPTPVIDNSTTNSGIPIIWLKQSNWQGGDKLEIRFAFRSPTVSPNSTKANAKEAGTKATELVQTTLAMLMSDSLPLSTASINQRMAPLAARANSYYDHESQVIGLTLSSQQKYLIPTLSLITNWLKQPEFKPRTFDNWKHQYKNKSSTQHQLEQALFSGPKQKQNDADITKITLEQVRQYYQNMRSSVSAIYVIGDLTSQAKLNVTQALNTITQDYHLTEASSEINKYESASHIIEHNKKTNKNILWQSQSAIALQPIASVTEWISLQIWGTDLVSTLNQQTHIDFVQLAFTLSPQHPWAHWSTQYAITQTAEKSTKDDLFLTAQSLVFSENVPSINDKDRFNELFDAFKEQLELQVQSPTWWSYVATQVAHSDGQLTLAQFANDYKEAVDTFTIDDYKNALIPLLKTSTYQEIQVYQ